MSTLAEVLKIYVPPAERTSPTSHDAGVEWSADVLAALVAMLRDFVVVVVTAGVRVVRSVYVARIGR